MKSQQLDQTIKTSCKDCFCAIFKDNTQTGCLFDRLEKFGKSAIEAYDNEKEFFIINRLCTYYRNKSWGYTLEDMPKVEKECALSFDIVFDCNTINEDSYIISDFINSCGYYDDKFNIYLNHSAENYNSVKTFVCEVASKCTKPINISISFNHDRYMHELAMNIKSINHMTVSNLSSLDKNLLQRINDTLNKDLKRFAVLKYHDILVINNYLYKSVYYHTRQDYHECVNIVIDISKKNNIFLTIP
jgi:hypothetical protein